MYRIQLFRAITSTFIIILISLIFAQQSYAAPNTVKSGVLTIGSDMTYPPYIYLKGKNERPSGFVAQFMHAVADHMGLKAKFADTRFAQLIIGLRAHRFDVVASILYITPKRAKVIDYVPYTQTGDSMIVLANGDFAPIEPRDLCGKRVSSIKGASWIPKLAKVSDEYCAPHDKADIDVREFGTAPGATQALLAHAVDAQFADAAVAKLAVKKSNGRLKITSNKLLFPIPVGLGVAKDNKALKKALTAAIKQMKKSGEYQRLLGQYNLAPPNVAQVKAALGE